MSVVLAALGAQDIGRTLDCLRAQTARGELELIVVVAGDIELAGVDEVALAFAGHAIVRLPEIRSKAAANAAGARRASAPVVAFAEDHCFPEPGWAEALIRRHRGAPAAVGPCIRNANPATALSWCDLLVNYAPWLGASSEEACEALPGHNTSYKTEALLRYGDRLDAWLEVENEMHLDMNRRGEELVMEPGAVVAHVNLSRWSSWLPCLFYAGRIYAAERCRKWSTGRRLVYGALWPLIGALRWIRLLCAWPSHAPGLPSRTRLAAPLLTGLMADAVGQACGYLAGAGDAGARMLRFEFEA
jgi:hypothetical protein